MCKWFCTSKVHMSGSEVDQYNREAASALQAHVLHFFPSPCTLHIFCCYSCFNSIVRGEPQVMGLKDFLEVCLGSVHMVSYWVSIMFSNMLGLSGSNPRARNLWSAPFTNPGVNEKIGASLVDKGIDDSQVCDQVFLEFRYTVIARRAKFQLKRAEDRDHIVQAKLLSNSLM